MRFELVRFGVVRGSMIWSDQLESVCLGAGRVTKEPARKKNCVRTAIPITAGSSTKRIRPHGRYSHGHCHARHTSRLSETCLEDKVGLGDESVRDRVNGGRPRNNVEGRLLLPPQNVGACAGAECSVFNTSYETIFIDSNRADCFVCTREQVSRMR